MTQRSIYCVTLIAGCALMMLFAATGTAFGQAVVTEYTTTEIELGLLQPGTVECPGGQPTGLWPIGPPCSAGSRFHIRGAVFAYIVNASDPRVSGKRFVVVNGNFDGWTIFGPGSGPMWGTTRLEVAGGGVWEGTWTGKRTVTGDNFFVSIRGEAHGTGGSVEGLKLDSKSAFGLTSPPVSTGRIIQPAGKG
jgi:hypothetical protein